MNRIHSLPKDTKWIVFGGSYAGTLAAWARLKYPHLIYAAVAASAPMFAVADLPGNYLFVHKYNTGGRTVESSVLGGREKIHGYQAPPGKEQ